MSSNDSKRLKGRPKRATAFSQTISNKVGRPKMAKHETQIKIKNTKNADHHPKRKRGRPPRFVPETQEKQNCTINPIPNLSKKFKPSRVDISSWDSEAWFDINPGEPPTDPNSIHDQQPEMQKKRPKSI